MLPTVLFVEDDDTLRELTTEALLMLSTQVIACLCADDALRVLERTEAVDLVLTDILMPGQLDGLELAKLIARRWPQLPIIVTSGDRLPDNTLPLQAIFIAKPWTLDELFHIVQPLLCKNRS